MLTADYIDEALNLEWIRYVFAKEASHHLIDNEEYHTYYPGEVIEYVVLDESELEIDGEPPQGVAAEYLTKFAAIELLFPYEFRETCRQEIEAGQQTIYSLAKVFEIPEHLVEYALGDNYMKFSAQVWAELPD